MGCVLVADAQPAVPAAILGGGRVQHSVEVPDTKLRMLQGALQLV